MIVMLELKSQESRIGDLRSIECIPCTIVNAMCEM